MEMRLNKIYWTILFQICFACKGNIKNNDLTEIPTQLRQDTIKIEIRRDTIKKEFQEEKNISIIDFFDKKYDEILFEMVLDESNVSDHPIKSFLDCKNEGYFTIHFIPKDKELRSFWENKFFEDYNFGEIDLEKEDKKIKSIMDNDYSKYNIFVCHIAKQYLYEDNCTFESIVCKKNAKISIYRYNFGLNKWNFEKIIDLNLLPPYYNNSFFYETFPDIW